MAKLYKTKIIVWTTFNPKDIETSELIREAEIGTDAYISDDQTEVVCDPLQDPEFTEGAKDFLIDLPNQLEELDKEDDSIEAS